MIITWEDLAESGTIIQIFFGTSYPDGLTEEEMRDSPEGWVRRAYARWKEAHVNGGEST